MYWKERSCTAPTAPFALHRNASPASSASALHLVGDTQARWATLASHVPSHQCGTLRVPALGSDIGGFNPTEEYTGELHVRWFQFGAFCRASARRPQLDSSCLGWARARWPFESASGGAAGELNNPAIEPIIKRYLEVRYRLLPYSYTASAKRTTRGCP